MGCYNSKIYDKSIITNNFYNFKICTFYIDISNLFIKNNYLEQIINYYFDCNNEYYIDLLCIQGIGDIYLYNIIINKFNKYLEKYNINKINKSNLYYYPYIKNSNNNTLTRWNVSNDTNNIINFNKLIISKYEIICSMEKYYDSDNLNHNLNIHYITIKFYNNLISCCNINILDIDINYNTNIIKFIKDTFNMYKKQVNNIENNLNNNIERKLYFFCGNIGIKEIQNNKINNNYSSFIIKLKLLDIFRYISGIKIK